MYSCLRKPHTVLKFDILQSSELNNHSKMQKNLKNHRLEVTKSDPGGDAYNATTVS